jgi:hypothetical protein
MHLLSKLLIRDAECRSLFINWAPIMSWPIGDDMTLLRTDLTPLLFENECERLSLFISSQVVPPPQNKVYDFGTAQRYVQWNAVFTARFAALSVMQMALWRAPPVPFDLFIDFNRPQISALNLGRRSDRREFAYCRSLAPFFVNSVTTLVLGAACANIWRCFIANRHLVTLYLRAVCDDFDPNVAPLSQFEEDCQPGTFLDLFENSKGDETRDFFWA